MRISIHTFVAVIVSVKFKLSLSRVRSNWMRICDAKKSKGFAQKTFIYFNCFRPSGINTWARWLWIVLFHDEWNNKISFITQRIVGFWHIRQFRKYSHIRTANGGARLTHTTCMMHVCSCLDSYLLGRHSIWKYNGCRHTATVEMLETKQFNN